MAMFNSYVSLPEGTVCHFNETRNSSFTYSEIPLNHSWSALFNHKLFLYVTTCWIPNTLDLIGIQSFKLESLKNHFFSAFHEPLVHILRLGPAVLEADLYSRHTTADKRSEDKSVGALEMWGDGQNPPALVGGLEHFFFHFIYGIIILLTFIFWYIFQRGSKHQPELDPGAQLANLPAHLAELLKAPFEARVFVVDLSSSPAWNSGDGGS